MEARRAAPGWCPALARDAAYHVTPARRYGTLISTDVQATWANVWIFPAVAACGLTGAAAAPRARAG